MKNKIITVCIMIVLPLILIGCNNYMTINFVINNETIHYECSKNTTVTNEILSEVTTLKIDGIYFDSEYTIKYNNEILTEDTTLYIKEKEQFMINFIINQNKCTYEYYDNIIVDDEIIQTISEEKIEGIYYDEFYTLKYKGEKLSDNIDLYIRLFNELTKDAIYFELDYYIFGINNNTYELRNIINSAKKSVFEESDLSKCVEIRDRAFTECDKYIEKVEKPNGEVSKENLCLELDYELSGVNYNIDLFTYIVKDAKQKILEEEDLSKCVDIKNNAISEIKKYSIDSYMHFIIMRSACMPQEDLDKYECLALTYDYVRSMKYYLGKYGDCYFYSTQSYMGFNQSVTDKYNFGNGYVGVYDVKTNKVYGIDKAYEQGIITLDQVKPVYEMYQYFKSLPDVNQGDNDF